MRAATMMALGFVLAWGMAQAAETAPTLEMSAEGVVQIGVDGKVTDYRLESKLSPNVAALVDKAVRAWEFEPIVIDGSPVVAKTAMHLSLIAEPAGAKDHYRLRVTNVHFGAPRQRRDTVKPPHYPIEAVQAHLGAKVLLAVRLDDSGKVVDAKPYQTSLDLRANSEFQAEKWRRVFESASLEAARNWHYDLSETINGKAVATKALVPIVFNVREAGTPPPAPGTWKAYVPGPVHDVPWLDHHDVADQHELDALADGEGLALESRFRLRDDVVGKTL